jgi:hypothetical protein
MDRVVAFDIDGALDTDKGFEEYQLAKATGKDNVVGIVTGRSETMAMAFLADSRLSPDFLETGFFKTWKLRDLKKEYDAEEYVYFGSWMKDRVAAQLAGWEYKEL